MAGDPEAKAFGRAVGWLEDLIRAGRDGPVGIRAALENQLHQGGASVETLAYAPATVPMTAEFAKAEVASSARETVTIGRLQGTGGGRRLILFAHPDTEPFAPEPAWQSDPFTATHRDGRLYGWGVADDLAGTAMLAAAAAMVQATDCRLQGELILVAAPSKRHRRGIGAALHAGLTGDAALYLHPAESGRGLGEIKAFAPGQLEFTITVEGAPPATSEPAHTAFAHLGVNPIAKAAKIMAALDAYDQRRAAALHHARLETAIGRSTNLMVTHINAGAAAVTTRLPGTCTLRAALSLVPGEVLEGVMREVEAVMAETAAADPWLSTHPPIIDWLAGVSAAETPGDDPFYRLVEGAIASTGPRPEVNPLHTSSDIRNPIIQAGIPTLGIGPLCGGLTMAGGTDEWIDVADLGRCIAVVHRIVRDWCGTDQA